MRVIGNAAGDLLEISTVIRSKPLALYWTSQRRKLTSGLCRPPIRCSCGEHRHVVGAAGDDDFVPVRGAGVVGALQDRLAAAGAEALAVEHQFARPTPYVEARGDASRTANAEIVCPSFDAYGDGAR